MKTPQRLQVAIACGGTGGHLFPGLAVAGALSRRNCDVTLMVSPKEVDQDAVKGVRGMGVVTLPAIALQGRNYGAFLGGVVRSYRAAARAFRKDRPHAVLVMGGFTGVAPVLSGRRRGALTFLHESNVIPGRANRWLAHVVAECFVGFPESADRLWHPRVTHTGTPVRDQFEPADPASCRLALGLDPQKPVLIVMGGSQGARGLNEVIVRALPALAAALPDLQYFHLSGTSDFDLVRAAHARTGRRALVRQFFSEVELLLGAATVAVSRAGASTLAEFAAMRVPGILIPFPDATDDHQHHNAAAFVRGGAASLIAQAAATPEILIQEICRVATNPVRREAMSSAAAKWHAPNAADAIADRMLQLTTAFHQLPASVAQAASAELSLRARPTHAA